MGASWFEEPLSKERQLTKAAGESDVANAIREPESSSFSKSSGVGPAWRPSVSSDSAPSSFSVTPLAAKGSRADLHLLLRKVHDATTSKSEEAAQFASIDEIYQAAKIKAPAHGMTILKVAELLRSKHLAGKSFEAKQAALMLVCETSGVKLEEIREDAAQRKRALSEYLARQQRAFEALDAQKQEQNKSIFVEMELMIQFYRSCIEKNFDDLGAEKMRLKELVTQVEQEKDRIREALSHCDSA